MLGQVPTEPERLARLILGAHGRAESAVFGRAPVEPVASAAERVAQAAAEARDTIRSVREVAGS